MNSRNIGNSNDPFDERNATELFLFLTLGRVAEPRRLPLAVSERVRRDAGRLMSHAPQQLELPVYLVGVGSSICYRGITGGAPFRREIAVPASFDVTCIGSLPCANTTPPMAMPAKNIAISITTITLSFRGGRSPRSCFSKSSWSRRSISALPENVHIKTSENYLRSACRRFAICRVLPSSASVPLQLEIFFHITD